MKDSLHNSLHRALISPACLFIPALLLLSFNLCADQIIYDDALENGWLDYGAASHNYSATTPAPVHSGTYSATVDMQFPFDLLWINLATPMSSTPFASLSFWINGDTQGGQQLWLRGVANGGTFFPPVALAAPVAGTWTHMTVSLSDLGVANLPDFQGIVFESSTSSAQPTFVLDDISLVSVPEPSVALMLAPALVGFAWLRRKNKKKYLGGDR